MKNRPHDGIKIWLTSVGAWVRQFLVDYRVGLWIFILFLCFQVTCTPPPHHVPYDFTVKKQERISISGVVQDRNAQAILSQVDVKLELIRGDVAREFFIMRIIKAGTDCALIKAWGKDYQTFNDLILKPNPQLVVETIVETTSDQGGKYAIDKEIKKRIGGYKGGEILFFLRVLFTKPGYKMRSFGVSSKCPDLIDTLKVVELEPVDSE